MAAWAWPAHAQVNTAPSYYSADGITDSYGGPQASWNGTPSYGAGRTGAPGDRAFSIGPGGALTVDDPAVGNFGVNDFTLHLYTRLAGGGGISQEILSKRAVCGFGSFLDLRAGLRFGGGVFFELQDHHNYGLHLHNPVDVLDGNWHEITVIRSGNLVSLSVDAITTTRHTNGVVDLNNTAPMRFGDGPCSAGPGRPGDTTTRATGELDDVSFGLGTQIIGPPAPPEANPPGAQLVPPPAPPVEATPPATPEPSTPETAAPEMSTPQTPATSAPAPSAPETTPATPPSAEPTAAPAPPAQPPAAPPPGQQHPPLAQAPTSGGGFLQGTAGEAFARSLPAPSQVSLQVKQVAQDSFLAILLLALLSLPIGLINDTLEANADRVAAFAARARRLRVRVVASWTDRVPLALSLALFALVGAVEYGFIEPSFGLDTSSMALVCGLAAGLLILSITRMSKRIYLYRVHSIRGILNIFPAFVLVGLACVLVSRIVGLQPGLILGTLAAMGAAAELRRDQEGKAAAIGSAVLLVAGALAWGLRSPLVAAAGPAGTFLPTALDVMLTTVVVAAAETLAFGLLPLSFLEGEALFKWSKPIWGLFAVLGAFAFVHVLLHPEGGAGDFAGRVGYLAVLLAVYFAVAIAFWAWFRFKKIDEEKAEREGDAAYR